MINSCEEELEWSQTETTMMYSIEHKFKLWKDNWESLEKSGNKYLKNSRIRVQKVNGTTTIFVLQGV